uniref:NADH dehydrogenase subunit 4L n=1 Tax=Camaena cicatricosa TaxID=1550735 RepID=A0A0A0QQ54_CAMCI|nr:NADH dehydrogenase subunit 4L [Camaena cicatricosa]AIS20793.1 NADH dehydrogenase subunit 4L [Camaena cicatricosa]
MNTLVLAVLFILLMPSFVFLHKKNLLVCLIVLEVMFYSLLIIYLYICLSVFSSATYFIMLLCFAAGGAGIGLSLLVVLSRCYGNDLISNLK